MLSLSTQMKSELSNDATRVREQALAVQVMSCPRFERAKAFHPNAVLADRPVSSDDEVKSSEWKPYILESQRLLPPTISLRTCFSTYRASATHVKRVLGIVFPDLPLRFCANAANLRHFPVGQQKPLDPPLAGLFLFVPEPNRAHS
jgi:hypothetical protein